MRVEATSPGGSSQRHEAEVGVDEGRDRHQLGRACDVRDDEAIEVVDHPPGEDFPEWAHVAAVGPLHGAQVRGTLRLEDHYWRVSDSNEDQVECQSAGAAVAVDEGVNLFERIVESRGDLGGRLAIGDPGGHRGSARRPRLQHGSDEGP